MNFSKQVIYAIGLAIIFLLAHILVLQLKLSEGAVFVSILTTMILIQIIAYNILKKNTSSKLSFKPVFSFLAITQIASVFLLTLYSALFPSPTTPPVKIADVLVSLLLFAVILPGLTTLASRS